MFAGSRSLNRWMKRVAIAVVLLAVGSMVGVLALSSRPTQIESVVVVDEAAIRRSSDAYAARLTGLADHYAATSAGQERSFAAYGARYAGMAERYLGRSGMSERGIAAYGARCAGIAAHYASTGK